MILSCWKSPVGAAAIITGSRKTNMLSIHYFASTRESVGLSEESIELGGEISTIADLVDFLCIRHSGFKQANETANKLLVSVNQSVVDRSHKLHDGDEIAFFPPMTGG